MAVIRLGGFRGTMPRIHPRLLPDGMAQIATNCRLDSGAVESVRDLLNLQPTTLSSPISLYRYSASVWLEATTDTDFVTYPIANDDYGRVIFADPSAGALRVTDASLVGSGGYPAAYRNLDVPPPTTGASAVLNGTADDTDEVPETRFYVVTFVNEWGAEGPPSPPTNEIEWRTGQTVTLSSLPSVPSGSYNITHRRIYRLNTGASGATNYQFLTEVAVSTNTTSVTAITLANPVVVTTAVSHTLVEGQEVVMTGLGGGPNQTITGITKANPCRVTAVGHPFVTGETLEFSDLGGGNGMDELEGIRAVCTVVNADKVDLDLIDSTAYTTWVAGGLVRRNRGMDELQGNQYIVSIIDTTSVSLVGVDGTGYYPYVDTTGLINQVAGVSYTDAIPSANLAEVIPTEIYDPPNSATVGLRAHPAGFLVGYFGNTLAFSEPGAPHAWPIDYRLSTNHDIVGVGVFGGTIAVVTEGWPYLVMGSDPAALTMVELEIEQACVSKPGIVDFGSAIAYPSPDGLIVISTQGAVNATASVMNRDQWQALVPSSFVAFNWEQEYLCFYNDGTDTQAFLINPFAPDLGIRYVTKYATGGYKDIEEDLLYLIVSDEIEKWDQSTTNLSYTWKSRPTYTPRAVNMAAGKIIADAYPITMELFVDDVKRFTKVVQSIDAFRMPGGYRGEKYEVVIKGTRKVSEVTLATTMTEMSAVI